MGGSHSREDLELSDSDAESQQEEEDSYQDVSTETPEKSSSAGRNRPITPSSFDEVESKLKALKLKYPSTATQSQQSPNPNFKNGVKLYLHIGGNTPKAKWVTSEKLTSYSFIKTSKINCQNEEEEEEEEEESESEEVAWWVLKVSTKIRAKVAVEMQLKTFKEQRRVDFVAEGVWAMKFFSDEDYKLFNSKYQDCLFENTFGYESNEANKVKVYGKDFVGWADPGKADDSMWEDAEDEFLKSPGSATASRNQDLREEFEEAANGGIQSLALGALDNSFLVGDSGIQVVKNFSHGIHGKGVYVNFGGGSHSSGSNLVHSTPKKALLMRAETNMLLMSPMNEGKLHSTGLHQLDIETGKIITEWKFEKDGTDITMRDIANDSKGAQLDPSGSTFLGLDDNRLCRWDMRDRHGIVQNLASANTPVLNWTQGHQFSRGTNFQCFASTGDGSIVVGSLDGKIRLYSTNSMRQAKTAFPGLGSPITHVDVTFDGKWILGTTDTYMILICSLFTDKDGKTKTGFNGRMGNRIAAPRLLKLTPLDSHLAGVNNKFQKAQFSWVTENGKQERHLVATVGKFSVKNGSHECYRNQEGLKSCYCYKIVLKDDSIVDSRFMHDKFAVSDSPEAPLCRKCFSKTSVLYVWINLPGRLMSDFTVFGVLQHFASNLMSPRILLLYYLVESEAPVFSRMKYCHCDFLSFSPFLLAVEELGSLAPCLSSSLCFLSKNINKSSFGAAETFLPAKPSSTRCTPVVVHAQQRPTWLPGLDPPPYLDGTLAGDFGFDPLGLGEDPQSLKWYVQAELVHARFAMAGVAGILFTDLLRVTGIRNLPVWYEAGAVKFEFASTRTLIVVQLLLMGFAETKRYMDFVSPGSQAKEGSFFGLESALEGLEPGYPGGPLLNPLGLARDMENAHVWKLKEIKNGRLAMVAMVGIFVQAAVTHAGPIDNLIEHLSNPWHRTIIQTLANSGS
ncbi:hypothetical protein NC652_032349 [Populus alba x Populus x berolinensis]|nr:hypothetical protein NC652_032112 [Populus alba x Populus x berolinensis]KAJ6878783.1 hypothetical protein NC652_032349 [Populus alba x Populus x berolinensis]